MQKFCTTPLPLLASLWDEIYGSYLEQVNFKYIYKTKPVFACESNVITKYNM